MTKKIDRRRALLEALGYNQCLEDLTIKANQLRTLKFPEAAKQVEKACNKLINIKEDYLSGKIKSGEDFISGALSINEELKSGSLNNNKIIIEVIALIKNLIDSIKNIFGQKVLIAKSMDKITSELSKTLNYSKNYTMFKPEPTKEQLKNENAKDDEPEPPKYLDVD